jgi:hypothetical protein
MTSSNGQSPEPERLDLSSYEPKSMPVTIAGREYQIPNDVPLALMIRAETIAEQMKALTETSGSLDPSTLATAEEALWEVVEALLSTASPPLDKPVRQLLSRMGAFLLLGFLNRGLIGEGASSLTLLPSLPLSKAPSPSVNSRKARRSTKPVSR